MRQKLIINSHLIQSNFPREKTPLDHSSTTTETLNSGSISVPKVATVRNDSNSVQPPISTSPPLNGTKGNSSNETVKNGSSFDTSSNNTFKKVASSKIEKVNDTATKPSNKSGTSSKVTKLTQAPKKLNANTPIKINSNVKVVSTKVTLVRPYTNTFLFEAKLRANSIK